MSSVTPIADTSEVSLNRLTHMVPIGGIMRVIALRDHDAAHHLGFGHAEGEARLGLAPPHGGDPGAVDLGHERGDVEAEGDEARNRRGRR